MEARLQLLQSSLDAKHSTLRASLLEQADSSVSEALVREMVKSQVHQEGQKLLDDARQQWLSEVRMHMHMHMHTYYACTFKSLVIQYKVCFFSFVLPSWSVNFIYQLFFD